MRASRVATALNRAVLISLAAPALVACSGGTTSSRDNSTNGSSSGSMTDAGSSGCAVQASDAGGSSVPLCDPSFPLEGPASSCHPNDVGVLTKEQCDVLCAPRVPVLCSVTDETEGGYVQCYYGPCGTGRRPEGLARTHLGGPDAAACFLAEMAYLEAASVEAFERMTRELEAHGAPRRLCDASRRAARDEVRHARVATRLAKRAGATVPGFSLEPVRERSLEEMAIENAVEGCVRETFGAAVAILQCRQAGDASVRRAMKSIARDEMRHAELSWAVARWLDTKLDAGGRDRVRRARSRAVEALIQGAAREPDARVAGRLGIPTAHQASVALRDLRASLWSAPLERAMVP
jgi:hypothetical protein